MLDAEAAILAGGKSRRLGRDKALLPWNGRPLVEHLAATLGPLFTRVRVIANQPQSFAALGLTVAPDLRPGTGALGGLHAALATSAHDLVFLSACDLPFLSEAFVRALAHRAAGWDAVVPWTERGPDPLCAFYTRSCLPAIEAALDRGELKVTTFFESIRVRAVGGDELAALDPGGWALFNLNTEEDYRRALARAGAPGLPPGRP